VSEADINWLSAERSEKFNSFLTKRHSNFYYSKNSSCFLSYKFLVYLVPVWEGILCMHGMLLIQLLPNLLTAIADPPVTFLKWGTHSSYTSQTSFTPLEDKQGVMYRELLMTGWVCWWAGSGSISRFSEVFKTRRYVADSHNSSIKHLSC
jgi:hypothetical protein